MHTDVRGDVITLYSGGPAGVPLASKAEVVGALTPDMAFADMLLQESLISMEVLGSSEGGAVKGGKGG